MNLRLLMIIASQSDEKKYLDVLEKYKVTPEKIIIEITETVKIENKEKAGIFISELKESEREPSCGLQPASITPQNIINNVITMLHNFFIVLSCISFFNLI